MPLAEGPIVFLLFGPDFSSERLREKCLHQVGPTHHVPTALIFMEITESFIIGTFFKVNITR